MGIVFSLGLAGGARFRVRGQGCADSTGNEWKCTNGPDKAINTNLCMCVLFVLFDFTTE